MHTRLNLQLIDVLDEQSKRRKLYHVHTSITYAPRLLQSTAQSEVSRVIYLIMYIYM